MHRSRIFSIVLALAAITHPGIAAIGPERALPVRAAGLHAVGFDGNDFLIAYTIDPGLYIQRVSSDGSLIGGAIAISSVWPRRVELASISGSTAVLWTECANRQCMLSGRWLDASVSERVILNENVADFAVAPSRDETVFVAWTDNDNPRVVLQLSEYGRHATTLTRTRQIVRENHGSWIGPIYLASSGEEMLAGWAQEYMLNHPMPEPHYTSRLKVQALDSSGRPRGSPFALGYAHVRTFEGDADGFLVAAAGHPFDRSRITRIKDARVVWQMPYLQTTWLARVIEAEDHLLAVTIRRAPGIDRNNSYLTVRAGDDEATYPLTSDPESYEVETRITRGNDGRMIAAYLTEDRLSARRTVAYRIIDPSPPVFHGWVPAPPRIVAADPASRHINVAWDPVPGAISYRLVETIVDEPDYAVEYVFGPETTSTSIYAGLPETAYSFEIIVENAFQFSNRSPSVVHHTPASWQPRAPLHVTATMGRNGTVTLHWSDKSSNEDGFRIVWGLRIMTLITVPANQTEATIDLPRPSVYPLHVVAFNEKGEAYSDSVVVEIPAPARRRPSGR